MLTKPRTCMICGRSHGGWRYDWLDRVVMDDANLRYAALAPARSRPSQELHGCDWVVAPTLFLKHGICDESVFLQMFAEAVRCFTLRIEERRS